VADRVGVGRGTGADDRPAIEANRDTMLLSENLEGSAPEHDQGRQRKQAAS
jgi:hypothetical protein